MKAGVIRIGIVDDHAITRAGLRELFSTEVDLRVVGEAATGREAIDLVRTADLDVIVMDLEMPGQSGIDALARMRARAPQVGVLVLTGYPEAQYATTLLRKGVSCYLNKDCDPQEILRAVRATAAGRRHITPVVADLLATQLNKRNDTRLHKQLSDREFQLLLKLARGMPVKAIGQELSLSVKTVSTYKTRILKKLGVHTISDLTYYAIKNSLLD